MNMARQLGTSTLDPSPSLTPTLLFEALGPSRLLEFSQVLDYVHHYARGEKL
jgi:hypothetical protein